MRKLPRIEQSIFGEPWAITPQMFGTICDVVEAATLDAIAAPKEFKAEKPRLQMMAGLPVIPITGVISRRMNLFSNISGGTSVEALDAQFTEAMASSADTIIFHADSPGGSVPGVPEFATRVYEAAKTSSKRIVGLIDGTGASACYWIMAQCDELYCTEASQVGSIGVVASITDSSRMEKNAGLEQTVLRSSPMKAIGVGPISQPQAQSLQARVDAVASMFKAAVSRSRPLDFEAFDPGEVFIGRPVPPARGAVDMGLCDGIATLDALLKKYGSEK